MFLFLKNTCLLYYYYYYYFYTVYILKNQFLLFCYFPMLPTLWFSARQQVKLTFYEM